MPEPTMPNPFPGSAAWIPIGEALSRLASAATQVQQYAQAAYRDADQFYDSQLDLLTEIAGDVVRNWDEARALLNP